MRDRLQPRRWLSFLIAGLVIGLLEILLAISFGAFIFSGPMDPFVARGIGLLLVGGMLSGVIIALGTSLPGVTGGVQDAPAAIMAVIAAAIVVTMPAGASPQDTFVTVVAAMALSTLLAGLFFLLLGVLRSGGLVRYLPFPVVGGFLAGTGWLLASGAVSLMSDLSVSLSDLPALLQPDALLRWVPGLFFAILLLIVLSRTDHPLALPALFAAGVAAFYFVLWLAGMSVTEAQDAGLMLGPFPEGQLWQPLGLRELGAVSWPAVLGQLANIATILILSSIGLLLNAGGLELAVKKDIGLDQELRAAGLANVVIGALGGLTSFQQIGTSALVFRTRADSRATGLIAAGLVLLFLFAGAGTLALLPKAVLGGLLLFLGLTFLYEWVYQAWFKLPKMEYAILALILIVIIAVGFLEGVGIGLLAAVLLFVLSYSRTTVVRHTLSGADMQSRVTRRAEQRQLLHREGEQLTILQLQGYIFFATADRLLARVRERLADVSLPKVRFVLLDFRRVTGVDSTALMSFKRLLQLTQKHEAALLFSELSDKLRRQLARDELAEQPPDLLMFPDLDRAIEWSEDRLLESFGEQPGARCTVLDQLLWLEPDAEVVRRILSYFEYIQVSAGEVVIREGDEPDTLFLVDGGQVTALLERPGKPPLRLETMSSGRVIGELGFYLGQARTASVVADEPSQLYRLRRGQLEQLEAEHPAVAGTFHRMMVRLLSERVTHLTRIVEALRE